jgi:DNA-binding CsgD family transcriptional regulator
MLFVAFRGKNADASALIEANAREATARGEGRVSGLGDYQAAVLYNGLGRYHAALASAERACEHDDLGAFGYALVELVEAGARGDAPEVAATALRRLEERTIASGTDWALGLLARSRALLGDGRAADMLYREAIERLARTRVAIHLARAHLVYGEWLRGENRRLDAREQLRTAYDMLHRFGAEAFAERARRGLLATGESVRRRTVEARRVLTAQEAQIARLAGDGMTNSEIGSQLFLSPRTVEWHLHKVFTKLDVNSRSKLRGALAGG